jgi:DNA-binding NarL/FixJ family response regulator
VVGEAEDGAVAVERFRALRPDIVIMDLAMPGRGGIKGTEDLLRECPKARVIVLTMHDDRSYLRLAQMAGAMGFVLKTALATELLDAIRAVHAGRSYFSTPEPPPALPPGIESLDRISEREREVLTLIALGHTTPEIAARLHIGEKTVETHRAHIAQKLGLRTRADLVRFALEHGLLKG